MSIEKKCENCRDEIENYIEYVKQLSNLFGKQELYQQLLEELVHYKWPIITKDKLICILLKREHRIEEIKKGAVNEYRVFY